MKQNEKENYVSEWTNYIIVRIDREIDFYRRKVTLYKDKVEELLELRKRFEEY